MKHCFLTILAMLGLSAILSAQKPVNLRVDASERVGEMSTLWAWFGYDEPNYTYMKDGRKLLTELSELSPVPVHIRAHNLMSTGDGTAAFKWGSTNMYTEDEDGNPIYYWEIIDRIIDTYMDRGMKPLMEVGFMPEALTTYDGEYRHHWVPGRPYGEIYKGWAYPPKSYEKWAELVYQWVLHCVDRYGKEEVESWYWELWNEPDIDYWQGSVEEFCKLYDYTVDAITRALPTATVGGPDTTNPSNRHAAGYLRSFLDHCVSGTNYVTGEKGTRIDFIAFHAKGAPRVVEDHVVMNVGVHLRNVDSGCAIVASYPELKDLPIIIGESDPEGCAACGMYTNPENAYRNGTMYSSYTAASFARKYEIADKYGVNLTGAVSWSFEFEDQPWFHGFRDLATNGVDKPVLNVFRMYGKMSGDRVKVSGGAYGLEDMLKESVRGENDDVSALASLSDHSLAVMVWDYHDADLENEDSVVTIDISNVPAKKATLKHYRIDSSHSNAYEAWKAMGSPQEPTAAQIAELEQAGQLAEYAPQKEVSFRKGAAKEVFTLPRQGVSLLLYEW